MAGPKPSEGHNTAVSLFEDYPAISSRLSKKEKKGIKQTARQLFELEGPGSAISYLAGQRGYTNFRPDSLMGKFMAKEVDYDRFKPIGSFSFKDLLGRAPSEEEWQQTTEYARAMGVKDPNAFQSLLNQRIASTPEGQAKIKSESDIQWESQHGNMARDPEGNLMRGFFYYNPDTVASLVKSMTGLS